MKKVLIIGFFWPYLDGSKRIIGLAKFLPKFGWQPIILTAPLKQKPDSEFRVVETAYRCFLGSLVRVFGLNQKIDIGYQLQARVKKTSLRLKFFLRLLYNLVKEIIAYPDEHKKWKPFAVDAANNLFHGEKIDAIISIHPITSHLVAKELKEKYKTSWIADFPDLWSENAAYPYSPLRKIFDKRLEIKTLDTADAITTSSLFYKQRLEKLHRGKRVYSVTMGFDPNILNISPTPLTNKFTITYTGIFYPKKRDPSKFFKALSDLISKRTIDPEDVEVRFYGSSKKEIEEEIKKYRLAGTVKQYEAIPLNECIEKQRESQVLLQLNWEDKNDKGVFSGKLFDYLAAGRPILAAGGSGNDEISKEILSETNSGVYCPTVENIKNYLVDFYREYKEKGEVIYRGNLGKVKKYSSEEMAGQFADILNQIVKNNI